MNKIVLFGIVGAAGCLVGWGIGEVLLRIAMPAKSADSDYTPSLVSKPAPPPPPPVATRPPPPPEIERRVREAGGKTGDVQASLEWHNFNDLDLHCIDPEGEEISFKHKRSRSQGELDVDRNAGGRQTQTPIENIRWLEGTAPRGKYHVYVNHFNNHGEPDPTAFHVSILVGYKRQEFDGKISKGQPKQLIHEFEFPPPAELRLSSPSNVEMVQGDKNSFIVRIAREWYDGPVTIRGESLPGGMIVREVTIPAGANEAEIEVQAESATKDGTHSIRLLASGGGASTESKIDAVVKKSFKPSAWSLRLIFVIAVWTAVLAICLSVALAIGQNRYLGKAPLSTPQLAVLVPGGLLAGGVAGAVGQSLFSVLSQAELMPQLGFLAGWMLLGGLLGLGISFFVPNLGKDKGCVAGIIGGFVGAGAFIAVTIGAGDVAGRFLGAAILGLAIGLMVALVEAAFRTAWLEIGQGVEIRTVNLGPEPVSIGSDARMCTVYVREAPPRAFRYWLDNGKVLCEDMTTAQRTEKQPGETQSLGSVAIRICTGSSQLVPIQPSQKPIVPPPPPVRKPVPPAPTATAAPSQPAVLPSAGDRPTRSDAPAPTRQAAPLPPPPRLSPPQSAVSTKTPGAASQPAIPGRQVPPPPPPPRAK